MNFKYTYFIDRALGKSIGKALQDLGVQIEFHKDHFEPDSPDTEWLPIVSKNGWIVLTKDENIGRRKIEIKSFADCQGRVFVLVARNLSTQKIIDIFSNTMTRIEQFTENNQAPFMAKIYQNYKVILWRDSDTIYKN
jgi:predicted nuclease of predicted toxin-antitoxin system